MKGLRTISFLIALLFIIPATTEGVADILEPAASQPLENGLLATDNGLRTQVAESHSRKISESAAGPSTFTEAPVAELILMEGQPPSPDGDPGSGWTYDILVSDQGWNLYADGFQSMETDPTNNNDIYIVYESWTDFASGIDQGCLAVRRSTNGGETWSAEIYVFYFPIQINGVYPDMKEADIAIGLDGQIWITYTLFAYDGPSRNIVDMQVDVQTANTAFWGTPAPWANEMVTADYGTAYVVHRLPTISIDQPGNVPVITAMSYDAIAATQSSVVAWQPGATEWDGYEVLGGGPVIANYVQYPCQDSGAFTLYLTAMNYYETDMVFDMRIWSSDDGTTWTALTDIYDDASVYSFYKPSIAATKSGTDYVMCAATYTNNPSDQSLGDIAYAYSLNGGGAWDSYTLPQANYQRMPYVQEDIDKTYFLMSYRQEDGGSTYSTRYILASTSDLTSWFGPEIASDTGAHQASNWFAHVAVQRRPDGQDYPCIAWSDLRDAAMPVTETSQTHIVYSTYGARFTIDTDPTGLDVIVDGITQTAPYIANWPAGYEHVLEAIDPQTGGGGETYLFQDWSTGEEELIIYVQSDLTDAAYTANYLTIIQHAIPLLEGWNLISTPLYPLDDNIDFVLSSIGGKWDCAMAYDTIWDMWRTNSVHRPDQLDDLLSLDSTRGFWINITESGVDFIAEGILFPSIPITLRAGWNLVGYPTLTQRSVAAALAGTGYTAVEGFDSGDPYRLRPLGDSYIMKPGEGYWIQVPADTTWTVDW